MILMNIVKLSRKASGERKKKIGPKYLFLVFGQGSGNLTFFDFLGSCTFSIRLQKKNEKIDGLIMSSDSNNFFTKVSKAPVETKRIHLFNSLRTEIVDYLWSTLKKR